MYMWNHLLSFCPWSLETDNTSTMFSFSGNELSIFYRQVNVVDEFFSLFLYLQLIKYSTTLFTNNVISNYPLINKLWTVQAEEL